jgi:hypothetical protein
MSSSMSDEEESQEGIRQTDLKRVVDSSGNDVADVELQVGKQTVFAGATGEFELTVGKRKAYVASAEGWRILSGTNVEPGESVTIVVQHLH